jgi:hypothetical protein
MKTIIYAVFGSFLLLTSCSKEPSLDKYFVENATSKNFLAVDVSPAMFNTPKSKLTKDQLDALKSFKKMNVLYFKKTATNTKEFEIERAKIKAILKDEKYQDLMRLGMGKDGANISYVGTENHISEFIISGSKIDVGLGIVRIQGKDMNPNDVMKVVEAMQSGNFDMEALKPIFDMIKT